MRRMAIVFGLMLAVNAVSARVAEMPDLPRMWPLLVLEADENETEIEVLWPLFRIYRSPWKTSGHLLLTAYQRDHRKGETVWDFLWPVWRLWSDDEGHFRLRFVPLFFGRDRRIRYGVLFPEFWWLAHDEDEYIILVLPWGRVKDGDRFVNLLTPLYWGRDKKKDFGGLLPFAFWKSDKSEKSVLVLPVFWWKRRSDDSYTFVLLPFARHQEDASEAINVLGPVVWGREQYYAREGELDERFGAVLPLLFWKSNPRKTHLVLFPELWWFRRDVGDYTFLLLPWGRHRESEDSYLNLLTPVIWGRDGGDHYGVAAPLAGWSWDHEGDYLFALFHNYIFFAIFGEPGSARGFDAGILPWWVARDGDRRFGNLFPVLWQRTGDELDSLIALPLLYWFRETRIILPLFWDFGKTVLFVPFYGKGKWADWDWKTILPPGYIRWEKGAYTQHDVLWPIFSWGDGGGRELRAALPFYRYQKKGETTLRHFLIPLVTWKDRADYTLRRYLPFYEYEKGRDYTLHSFLGYLGAHGRGEDRKHDRLFPLFIRDQKRDRRYLALLWPAFRDKRTQHSHDSRLLSFLPIGLGRLDPTRKTWHALNLFWWGRSPKDRAASHSERRHGLYPVYGFEQSVAQADTAERHVASFELRLLDPVEPLDTREFRFSATPLKFLFPFFEIRKNDTGYSHWKMPLGLFKWQRGRGDEGLRVVVATWLGFYYDARLDAGRRDLHVLSLFWDIVRPKRHSQGLWPFYTYRRDESFGLNRSFLDPLWFWGEARVSGEEHISALLKLFDYRRRPDSLFHMLWPIYSYRRNERGGLNMSFLDPLWFWGDTTAKEEHVSALLKLFDYRRKPDSLFHMLWPVYSYKRHDRGGVNASFLDPLWFWGEATGEEEHVSAFFKILDYRRQANGDSRLRVLWRAFHRATEGERTSTEAFPFLHWEKSPDVSRFSFCWRLFQVEKRDGKRSFRIFFSPRINLGG